MVIGLHKAHLCMYLAIFFAIIIGWLAHSLYLEFSGDSDDIVLVPNSNSFLSQLNNFLTLSSAEIISPEDHIKEEQINIYDDKVVLEIEGPIWSSFTDTNSMDPLLDINANGIEIVPKTEDDIHIGDVISYKTSSGIVVHRVIDIGNDEEGVYYTVKGDNNLIEDNVKIRFSDIQGILVAVVY